MLALLIAVLFAGPALAQEHHHRNHSDYQGWFNQKGEGCCNNQDCGELAPRHERTRGGVLEVEIEGTWCKVEPHHYLKSGNVPNAAVSHVCVWRPWAKPELPHACQRLLCYQPRPLS